MMENICCALGAVLFCMIWLLVMIIVMYSQEEKKRDEFIDDLMKLNEKMLETNKKTLDLARRINDDYDRIVKVIRRANGWDD